MPVCDGCGRNVDEAHIRQRIERLELATRFRPIHIGVLLIDAAPPARTEDFFYSIRRDGVRSAAGQSYFDALAKLAGVEVVTGPAQRESVLTEFQRRGLFLTSAVECPVGDSDELRSAVRRLAPTVLRRAQTSYKPKHIALISEPTSDLIETFRTAGWGDRVILDHGAPFAVESIGKLLIFASTQAG
ncbi:MAG TPA: hypothetical protein VMF66_06625 [Candidatus Acidoferrum sp.]|nr:hypothetical protein [Candidatus Acidoferrum sp.]